jgi:hypothetical protein
MSCIKTALRGIAFFLEAIFHLFTGGEFAKKKRPPVEGEH